MKNTRALVDLVLVSHPPDIHPEDLVEPVTRALPDVSTAMPRP